MIRVRIKKLRKEAVLPKYALEGDAGMDVVAISKKKGEKYIEYGTGLALEVPENHVCLIFPRSSVSNKDLILSNCVGVLDSGYRGELILRFRSLGNEEYEIGDKVGQIMVLPFPKIIFEEVENLSNSLRESGGFGSTG